MLFSINFNRLDLSVLIIIAAHNFPVNNFGLQL